LITKYGNLSEEWLSEFIKCESIIRPIYITEEDRILEYDFDYILQESGIYQLIPKYPKLNQCKAYFGSYVAFSKSQADRLISGFSVFEEAETDFWSDRYNEAIQKYEKALSLDYRTSDSNKGLGWSYLSMNNMAKAEFYFDKAIASEPNSPDAINGLGWAKLKGGNCEQAKPLFTQALAFMPNLTGAIKGLENCNR
jgi:tetratricopeptide (TPR) repeat protein